MKNAFYVFLRVAVGAVFVVSGYSKLLEPFQDFLAAIHGYRLVTGWPALAVALALPWAELVVGVWAVAGLWTRASLAALWAMNAVFLAAVGSAIARGLPLESCGCFGEAGGLHFAPREIFVVDLALTLVFVLLARAPRPACAWSLDAFFSKSASSTRP